MKPLITIFGPVATRSGYGGMARDIASMIIASDKYEVMIVSAPWGHTPMNALNPNNPKDKLILDCIKPQPVQVPRQPDMHIHIGVPNEMQCYGKLNILATAGIETTAVSKEWVDGCNRADVIFTISEHSKRVFETTTIEERNQEGATVAVHKITKPIEVLHNCVHTDIFRKLTPTEIPQSVDDELVKIKESFCYLFVGHWLKGKIGEDRKNVGLLVKVFCETFKNTLKAKQPALILKTSGATFSYMDQKDILGKIEAVRKSVGPTAPKVYLLHGELTDEEMNGLFNHPKVKVHVSFTKGEGFGRPLLEATLSQKPVIASGWSGHLDFLNPQEALLVGGELRNVDESAVWQGVIIPESQWFNIDINQSANALMFACKRYDGLLDNAKSLAKKNKDAFSYQAIQQKTLELLDKYMPKTSTIMPLKLPELRKVATPTPITQNVGT